MIASAAFISLAVFLPAVFSANICYEPFGCYSLDSPSYQTSTRIKPLQPEDPGKIQTQFFLYTRKSTAKELIINNTDSIDHSGFEIGYKTRLIIHGFLADGNEQWVKNLTAELLKYEETNIIVVMWGNGAAGSYLQAAANARLVADQVVHLLQFIQREEEVPFSEMHIIGHGIGAHLAGYVGKKISKLGRITGLDPTQPYFYGQASTIRLDSGDAEYVDVIHSDGSSYNHLGYGMDQSVGHGDFFPNSGMDQPGCSRNNKIQGQRWDLLRINKLGRLQATNCDHLRAVELFTESINTNCPFVGFQCKNAQEFNNGFCNYCSKDYACIRFGFHSKKQPGKTNFFFDTNKQIPFCQYSFIANVVTSTYQEYTTARISVKVSGQKATSTSYFKINNYNRGDAIGGQATYSAVKEWNPQFGEMTSATVQYEDTGSWFSTDLILKKITMEVIDKDLTIKRYSNCATRTVRDYSVVKFDLKLNATC